MKKISLLFVGVLLCTLVFANGTDEPSSTSSVAVTNASGSSLFKVYYTANTADDVKVSILKPSGKIVFSETLRKTKGFVRPYNFNGLAEGKYVIKIEDTNGIRNESVYYSSGKVDKLIGIVKLSEQGKYLFTVNSKNADKVNVNIYNDKDELIHSHRSFVNKEFAEVFNLKNINAFTIEISDSNGLLKSIKYQ
jgi:hypothetical protein